MTPGDDSKLICCDKGDNILAKKMSLLRGYCRVCEHLHVISARKYNFNK